MRSLIIIQAVLVTLSVVGFYFYLGETTLVSALYGGAIAIVHTVLLSRRLDTAGDMANNNPEGGVLNLYLGVIQRFIFMLVMFGVGMGVFKLNPPSMIGTFALAQMAYMIYGARRGKL